ncbi:MAG: MerR family transcriptional regulator [Terriglobales bacterium]
MERNVYHVQAFAKLAGVTARTLRHYDRLGLLVPRRRAGARADAVGYRVYTPADLPRLEQILALRFVGFPLRQINTLLRGKALPLHPALEVQLQLLRDKRRRLDRALQAVEQALRTAKPDLTLLTKILEDLAMTGKTSEWTDKYYTKAAKAKIAARQSAFTPAMQEEVSRQWAELAKEVEAALDQDPASRHVQALAARWKKLVEGFTQGDPGITAGLKKTWADRDHWPPEMQQKTASFRPELLDLMQRAWRSAK